MKVSIHGPNLEDQSRGQYVVHAADSPDNSSVRHFGGERVDPFTFDAVSREQCALAVYEDQIEGGECDMETALADIHFGPSCNELQTAETASPIHTAIEPQRQDAVKEFPIKQAKRCNVLIESIKLAESVADWDEESIEILKEFYAEAVTEFEKQREAFEAKSDLHSYFEKH